MRTFTRAALCLLPVAVLPLVSAPAQANTTPTPTRIGYTVGRMDTNPSYSVTPQGLDRRVLIRTVTNTVDTDPSYGPGGRLAFVRVSSALDRYELRLQDPGKASRIVYVSKKRLAAPSWAPDGKHLALTVDDDATGAHLATIGADGTCLRMIFPASNPAGPPVTEQQPSWSPDGKLIAYRKQTDGAPAPTANIWVVNALGRPAPRQLTTGNALDQAPDWVGNGRVVFIREQDNADVSSRYSVLAVDAAPAAPGGVASPDVIVPAAEPELLDVDASPDGHSVAYTRHQWTDNAVGELHTVRLDGANDRLIRTDPATIVSVTWGSVPNAPAVTGAHRATALTGHPTVSRRKIW